MSGFVERGGRRQFELTGRKAARWHGVQPCGCLGLVEIYGEHLKPAGFVRRRSAAGPAWSWVAVEGPGIDEGSSVALYEAVSGRESRFDVEPEWALAPWHDRVRSEEEAGDGLS